MDIVEKSVRSRMMAGIRAKHTKPEVVVRKLLHRAGFRYSLHRKDLPGAPDMVLPKYKTAIFVHGCFWHLHHGCRLSKIPESNTVFWTEKLEGNRKRDRKQVDLLRSQGWRVLVVWECITRQEALHSKLVDEMSKFLRSETEFAELPANLI